MRSRSPSRSLLLLDVVAIGSIVLNTWLALNWLSFGEVLDVAGLR